MLLLNAGSSSLKCTLMKSQGAVVARASADWAGRAARYTFSGAVGSSTSEEVLWSGHPEALERMLDDLAVAPGSLAGVGHRIVHGGDVTSAVLLSPEARARIEALVDVAPLHNPPGLETLAAAEARLPGIPHVAVFDTAFHASLSAAARTYPIPAAWTQGRGIRRFGFHGSSHAYCARRTAEMLARPLEELRIVVCHLGHGCSAAAIGGGHSVDTTMGFTPLDGLMMATRSGAVDPGILLHLLRHGFTPEEIERELNRGSGLLGVSGVSADMREVLASAHAGNERARLAIDIYTHRIRQAVGALAVTLGGIDALVFTAGVGENSAEVRAASCAGLECLGLELDAEANERCAPDADVARQDSSGRILVIATREDVSMLGEVMKVIQR